AVRASLFQWDPDHRTAPGHGSRSEDDWNGWTGAPGRVEVATKGRDVELKAAPEREVAPTALFTFSTIDAFGRHDLADVHVDGRNPTLRVQQVPIGGDIIPPGKQDALRLDLRAYGGPVTLDNYTVAGETDEIVDTNVGPFEVDVDSATELTIGMKVTGSMAEDLVTLYAEDEGSWSAGGSNVIVQGYPYKGYVLRPPDYVEVDGAFGDWDLDGSGTIDDTPGDVVGHPDGPLEDRGVDLTVVSAAIGEDELTLFAQVSDGMLAGINVPHLPGSIPQGALDIDGDGRLDLDGDGIEDGMDTRDDDWDNDDGQPDDPDTGFRDTGPDDVDEDDDNDGIPDWNDPARGGPHVPGPPSDLPALEGRDVVEFLMDTDGDASTGYSPDGYPLGADHRVLVTGRDGRVTISTLYQHQGSSPSSWSWGSSGMVEYGIDATRLEVAVGLTDLAANGNISLLVRATGWTGAKDWSDRLLEGELETLGQVNVGGEVGALDPYALTDAGGFSISPTGTTWSEKSGPLDRGAIVDVAVGNGAQTGYVYALTAKGKVYVTSRAVNGWT
ncbi:MAG: hypothetical protein KAS77_00550, partial [Thermoplasmata archaeon]|nr:hypothetical protein [Thermoplasmata archaeon]